MLLISFNSSCFLCNRASDFFHQANESINFDTSLPRVPRTWPWWQGLIPGSVGFSHKWPVAQSSIVSFLLQNSTSQIATVCSCLGIWVFKMPPELPIQLCFQHSKTSLAQSSKLWTFKPVPNAHDPHGQASHSSPTSQYQCSLSAPFVLAATKSLRKGFTLAHSLTVQSIMAEKSWQWEHEATGNTYALHMQSGSRKKWTLGSHFLSPFHCIRDPSPLHGADRVQDGSFLFSSNFAESVP